MFKTLKTLAFVAVLGLAATLTPTAEAGHPDGPGLIKASVAARGANYHRITFLAGEVAVVGLTGDGDTDLDLYVYDANGNLVVYNENDHDDAMVRFVPRRTQTFTIKVVNRGRVYNEYDLGHN